MSSVSVTATHEFGNETMYLNHDPDSGMLASFVKKNARAAVPQKVKKMSMDVSSNL